MITTMKNREVVHRTWNRLRLALLWASKRSVLLAMEVRVVPKYLKCLGHTTLPTQSRYYYERELSFDKTPIFNVKMYRPSSMRLHFPCLKPQVDFEDDHDLDYEFRGKRSLMGTGYHDDDEETEVDERAEEFIAKFYQQMKLQRQFSHLQYNEAPNRDSC